MPSPVKILHLRRSRRSSDHLSLFARWITWGLSFVAVSFLGLAFLTGWIYVKLVKDLPPVGNIESMYSETRNGFLPPIRIYDRSHKELFDLLHPAAMGRQWLHVGDAGANALPAALQDAMVIAHDKTFWTNQGFDLGPVISAIFHKDRTGGELELPRSVTQQLIEMTILPSGDFLQTDPWRYLREALLAQRLTERYSKNQILEWYINSIGFGNLSYGADAAALVFFGVHANELTLAECATLAAISVERTNAPWITQKSVQELRISILQAMQDQGTISESQYQKARLEKVVFRGEPDTQDVDLQLYTMSRIEDVLGDAIANRAGLFVFTTLHPELQEPIRCTAEMLEQGISGQDNESLDMLPGSGACSFYEVISDFKSDGGDLMKGVEEIASIVLDSRSGEILSLYGPMDDPIPSTSMLYPLIYLAAFSRGNSPGTMVLDLPLDSVQGGRFDVNSSHGPVLMRNALIGGFPFAVQEMIHLVGLENVLQVMQHMGVSDFRLDLVHSQELGFPELYEISLMDAVRSYGILANSGKMIGTQNGYALQNDRRSLEPIYIKEIRDHTGRMLYEADPGEQSIVSPELAFLVTDILRDPAMKQEIWGQTNIPESGQPSAVICGIDRDNNISWTIGYTPSRVVGVWMKNRPGEETEIPVEPTVSSDVWQAFMTFVTQSQPFEDWQQPSGVQQVEICDPSGLLPTPYCPSVVKEFFLEGTQPVHYDTFYQSFRINKETGKFATLFTPLDLIVEKVFLVPPPEAMEWSREAGNLKPPEEYDTLEGKSAEESTVRIEIPENFAIIRGKRWISGQTKVDDFQYSRLQYGEGLNPTHWYQIGGNQTTPVIEGTLALWDTTGLDGLYALQLIVVDQSDIAYIDTKYVTIDNEGPEVELLCGGYNELLQWDRKQPLSCDVRASDNIEVSRVEFYLDEQRVRIDFTAPFRVQLEENGLSEGVLFARAYDLAGNVSQSESIQISIMQ